MNTFADIVREQHIAENPPVPRERPAVEEVTLPNGHVVRYEDAKHLYFIDGKRVDSVSTILKCLDKPALKWWGMKIGVAGVLALEERGARPTIADVDTIVDTLTAEKLTVNHVARRAADRGVTVHDALEAYCEQAELPNPELWPVEQRGFVEGLLAFLCDVGEMVPEATEQIVASAEYGYAGRYDLRARLTERTLCTFAHKKDPAKDVYSTVPSGRYRIDLKTSSGVYLEHFLQLGGYEGASIESGYEPTDAQAVLNVLEDGRYQFVLSPATHADFLAVLACHNAVSALAKRAA